jgi:hypothetical protein
VQIPALRRATAQGRRADGAPAPRTGRNRDLQICRRPLDSILIESRPGLGRKRAAGLFQTQLFDAFGNRRFPQAAVAGHQAGLTLELTAS